MKSFKSFINEEFDGKKILKLHTLFEDGLKDDRWSVRVSNQGKFTFELENGKLAFIGSITMMNQTFESIRAFAIKNFFVDENDIKDIEIIKTGINYKIDIIFKTPQLALEWFLKYRFNINTGLNDYIKHLNPTIEFILIKRFIDAINRNFKIV